MVKRIIGLPGDYIEYIDNVLYINEEAYEESFIDNIITTDFSIEELIGSYEKIPNDMYLVLGDNRVNSLDSRSYGLIEKKSIVGKVLINILPINRIKIIK